MKKTLASIGLAATLALGLAACAPSPAPPASIERLMTASPAKETTAPAPSAGPLPPALTIVEVEPMAFAATLDPPTLRDVFEIRDAEHRYLADTATGPRFLLAHATSPGNDPAPGNAWQELTVGDRVEALGTAWRIAERVEAPKSWLTDDPALVERTFGAGPGTLVFITCVPRWEGRATHNLILISAKETTP